MTVSVMKEERSSTGPRYKGAKCPYLSKLWPYKCRACTVLYAPSTFQLEEYCRNERHEKCPFI